MPRAPPLHPEEFIATHPTDDTWKDVSPAFKCPRGHTLPHKNDDNECTPEWCAGIKATHAGLLTKIAPRGLGAVEGEKTSLEEVQEEGQSEEMFRAARSMGRLAARQAYVPAPPLVEGPDAESYVTKKLLDLTPYAVQDLEYRLKFGNADERQDAAAEVLDRAGFAKSDTKVPNQGPVIILTGGAVVNLPWSEKVKTPPTIEGQKVE